MEWIQAKYHGEFFENGYDMDRQRWDIPETWLPMHYFEALSCLFRIENALRILVYFGLKREFKKDWLNISLSTEDKQTLSLKNLASRRSEKDKEFEYLTHALPCPLMYLTAGELTRIIFSESYGKLFKRYIPGSRTMMEAKLQEISCIRNALAHFRPVTAEQVGILKGNASHLLGKFKGMFHEAVFGVFKLQKNWKVPLKFNKIYPDTAILCRIGASKSGDWLCFEIEADAIILATQSTETKCVIDLAFLDLEQILRAFPSIAGPCILATHDADFPQWDGDSELPAITKRFRFVFPGSKGNMDPHSLLNILPECFQPDAPTPGADGKALFRQQKVTAKEGSWQGSKRWYISSPDLLGEDGVNKNQSTSNENWGSLQLAEVSEDSLFELPRYPWMRAVTVPIDY